VENHIKELYMFMFGKSPKEFSYSTSDWAKDIIRKYSKVGAKLKIKYLEWKSREAREVWGKPKIHRTRTLK